MIQGAKIEAELGWPCSGLRDNIMTRVNSLSRAKLKDQHVNNSKYLSFTKSCFRRHHQSQKAPLLGWQVTGLGSLVYHYARQE